MIARVTRPVAAVLLLLGGILHYNLWQHGYRHVPKIGPLFLANVVGSIALAGAILASRRVAVVVAAMVFAGGSLLALVLSRTVGVFGFMENIWTSEAINTLASELGVILALSLCLAAQLRRVRPSLQTNPVYVSAP